MAMQRFKCNPQYEAGCEYEGETETYYKLVDTDPQPETPETELPSIYDNTGLLSREPWQPSQNIGFGGFNQGLLNTETNMPVNTFSYEQKPFSLNRQPFTFDQTPFQHTEEMPFNFNRFNTYNRG